MVFLSDQDRATVSNAVRGAEARTSGEIVTVIALDSDSYFWPAAGVAGLVAFVIPGLIAPSIAIVSSGDLFFIQLASLIVLVAPLLVPRIRFALVPASIKRTAARRLAREQFIERGLHLTKDRTGVLIFVSIAEHYVEILADSGINAKVDQAAWQLIVDAFVMDVRNDRIVDGFCAAIQKVGDMLAQHFPADDKNPDELPNKLFVI